MPFFGGCSRDRVDIVDSRGQIPPTLNVEFTPDTLPAGSGNRLIVDITAEAGSNRIAGMQYSVAGLVNMADKFFYLPTVNSISESFIIDIPSEAPLESIISLSVQAYDLYNNGNSYTRDYYPLDYEPPQVTLYHDSVWSYPPGDSVPIDFTVSDNIAIDHIILSAGGGFVWQDTLWFESPYPTQIDTQILVPIKDTALFKLSFSVTAEVFDFNQNFRTTVLDHEVKIYDARGPGLEIHPADDNYVVRLSDSLRFWIVAKDNIPLRCLGFETYRWIPQYDGYGQWRDSVIDTDFAAIDSIYCAVNASEIVEDYLTVEIYGYDSNRNYKDTVAIKDKVFLTEGRIKISQAESFEFTNPGYTYRPVVDNFRNLVYLPFARLGHVAVYSIDQKTFLDPIPIDGAPRHASLTIDGERLLVTKVNDSSLAIVDLTGPRPSLDTTISLPYYTPYPHPDLDCNPIEVLSNDRAYIAHPYDSLNAIVELDLNTFEINSPEWGIKPPFRITASGNKGKLFFCNFTEIGIFDAQTNETVTGSVEADQYFITSGAADYSGSMFFCGGWLQNPYGQLSIFKDADLCLVDSIPQEFGAEIGCFSGNGLDFIFIGNTRHNLGLIDLTTMEVKESSRFRDWREGETMLVSLAINSYGTRLFVVEQAPNLVDYFFYDIPIEPR